MYAHITKICLSPGCPGSSSPTTDTWTHPLALVGPYNKPTALLLPVSYATTFPFVLIYEERESAHLHVIAYPQDNPREFEACSSVAKE